MTEPFNVTSLNERAHRLGYEVVESEPIWPVNAAGNPMADGWPVHCRVLKHGKPCFKFTWPLHEVHYWLGFREREARTPGRLL